MRVIRAYKRPFLYMVAAALTLSVLGSSCGGDGEAGGVATITPVSTGSPPPFSEQPKRGGTLRVAVVRDHSTFDPTKALATPDILVTRQAYDNLILLDPNDLSLKPMLAQSWESNDDLTQFTFYLRPNVKFHHGKGLAADDVVFSFNRLIDPDVGSRIAAGLDSVTKVVALDERTVRFYLDSPNAYLPDLTALLQARIIPSDIDLERLVTEEFGTGPFILKEHVAGERLVMVRNSDYWGEGASLPRPCNLLLYT